MLCAPAAAAESASAVRAMRSGTVNTLTGTASPPEDTMVTVAEHIASVDETICANIEALASRRDLLSQNILGQMRNLVEGVAVYIFTSDGDTDYNYKSTIPQALEWVSSRAKFNFIQRFHKLLQPSTSHYTFDGDTSERLMLRYYEYLLRLRKLLHDEKGIDILANLESFPLNQDPALAEYHNKIALAIEESEPPSSNHHDRYYILKTQPFVTNGQIYYEVTFCQAVNQSNKSQRIIAFTNIDIADNYAAVLDLQDTTIEAFGQQMPITLIRNWEVAIRPAEIKNFTRLLGQQIKKGRTDTDEYRFIMQILTTGSTLLDLIDASEDRYRSMRTQGTDKTRNPQIFPALDKARQIIRSQRPGHNILRYLLLRMRNRVLKPQYNFQSNSYLSNLNLAYGCIPFDSMPFCSMPLKHTPRFWDLINSLDPEGRTHEFLARRIQRNVEDRGMLYTPLSELEDFADINTLITTHNNAIYHKHRPARDLVLDKGHVFIQGYEDNAYNIITKLQSYAANGVAGYTPAVTHWLNTSTTVVDDSAKRDALTTLFSQSRVALIYGAAGTGKTRMVDHIANYFADKEKLFLANTNPAVENLRRRVTAPNSKFRTISDQNTKPRGSFELLVIDECSTVSNNDLLNILDNTDFKLLVLVGDVYQIEAIRFGNWFSIIRSYIPSTSIFELTSPFRTSKQSLIDFWTKVRSLDETIPETIARNHYSTRLNATLFENHSPQDIILALNYDGLYGINNINRFLQASNPNPAVTWGPAVYKVNDPVLFSDNDRFRGLIYNNLKGTITGIQAFKERIKFDICLDRPVTELDVERYPGLKWVADSTVRFSVYDMDPSNDDDEDNNISTVPFQVAYAVGIHKAQGLEYDTVKIVITEANEKDITHNIFYTAITRARNHLCIYWSPETQQAPL